MKPQTNVRRKPKILFILKLRQQSGGGYTTLKHSGLFNSATFVHDMLDANGFTTDLVQVVDNNQIDAAVTQYKPDIVIIEALWVVPEKFDILQKLHPKVKWIVRLHSEIPFLANEGIAMEWINGYVRQENVYVSTNSETSYRDLYKYLDVPRHRFLEKKLILLPNYYPVSNNILPVETHWDSRRTIDVGCFGAIRPMKNHLIQAFAAVQFAEENHLMCRFHINSGRVEGRGDAVLKNLRAFFAGLEHRHELVEHDWLDREEFLYVVQGMDIGLQVSFSETFNIVSADFVSEDIPMVTSKEIDWMPSIFTADPTDVQDIVKIMKRTLFYARHFSWTDLQRRSLKKYVNHSKDVWIDALKHF